MIMAYFSVSPWNDTGYLLSYSILGKYWKYPIRRTNRAKCSVDVRQLDLNRTVSVQRLGGRSV